MKFKMVLNIALCMLVAVSSSALADSATGKVTLIQAPTSTDVNTIYFKLDPMPQNVTQWLFVRNGSGTTAGCTLKGNEKTTDRALSILLMAKASSTDLTVSYCLNSNGYGLVNGSLMLK